MLTLVFSAACTSGPRDKHRNVYLKRSWSRDTQTSKYLGYRHPASITPVVFGDAVISGNAVDGIKAFSRKSGHQLWHVPLKRGAEGVFADTKSGVFLGSNDGKFYHLNSESGSVEWSYALNSESTSAPLVQGNFIFHMAMNGTFYCLEKESGRVIWVKTRPPKDNITVRGTTQPVFVDGKVMVGYSDGYFVAYNAADGGQVWEKQISDNRKFNDVDTTPAITDSCVAVANVTDTLYCLDKNTGQIRWQLAEGGGTQPIQTLGNNLVFSSDSSVMIVDGHSGKPIKRWDIEKKWGRPTSAVPYKKWLIFGLSEGPVVVMDQDTGHWDETFFTGRGVTAPPTVVPDTGEVFVVSQQANVYKLNVVQKDPSRQFLWERTSL